VTDTISPVSVCRDATRLAAAAAALSIAFGGCAVRRPLLDATPESQSAVVACSRGYNAATVSELRVTFEERGGRPIDDGESSFGAASTFQFGELRGEAAVAAYNLWVQCINNRIRTAPLL